MNVAEADFILTETELAALAARLVPGDGQLSLLPALLPEPAALEAAEAAFRDLPAEAQDRLHELLMVLAAPARVAALHYTVADESISRQFLAWPGEDAAALVFLARQGSQWRAGRRTAFEVQALATQVLAAGPGLRADPLSVGLSAPSVLVLLAVLDQLRYARLASLLAHQAPLASFAPAEVLARLADADIEDFRWPLCFFEKVLPARLPAALNADDVAAGLVELAAAGLVEPLADEEPAALYALTPTGQIIADTLLHDVSKLALRLSEIRFDGLVGHDAFLFTRGSFHLFLFELAGEAGAVAALDEEQFAALLADVLAPPAPEAVVATYPPAVEEAVPPQPAPADQAAPPITGQPKATPQANAVTSRCAQCGKPVHAKDRFCEHCGAPQGAQAEEIACPHCGQIISARAKFCGHCGGAVTAKVAPTATPPPPPEPTVPVASEPVAAGGGEIVLGVIPGARRSKGLLGLGGTTYSLVVTSHRLLFAELTGKMMQDSVKQARDAAETEGAGFFGKWAAGITTDYTAKYGTMTPEAILAEQPGNFFVMHDQVRTARFREETDSEGESSGYRLRLETAGEKLDLTFTDLDEKACRQLLGSVWGGRVRGL